MASKEGNWAHQKQSKLSELDKGQGSRVLCELQKQHGVFLQRVYLHPSGNTREAFKHRHPPYHQQELDRGHFGKELII